MNEQLNFTITADGSKTIFNPAIGEHYHSRHGALQESRHVFLQSGLNYFLGDEIKEASVLEVGFGTGLNFLVSADHCYLNNINLQYTGIEAFPLSLEIIRDSGYDQYISPQVWRAYAHAYEKALRKETSILPGCQLYIDTTTLLTFQSEKIFDVLYFDAFAAIHQPEMWTEEALRHVAGFLRKGGVFVTYAITGNLKRTMKSLGFSIEKAPGAAGKREMLRAVKL
ncbi:MAG: tRNA (5-methylaminomethyl-2-thiouridine)(34)-methyltransferase MnmD [Daejeonella sp.]|uniref:tRNA (5-methylaminomethyl-2-thiouridine)(34)-methyltransferase MnmD n=1 Tax=Daejeonella sp. JGW-45 TaxID=3034148 RepID=UPI0023EC8C67|nr:tRNA (5-methylaminomethyl-2-thiouridine)(34)-methyltransferase MnmD [Daejeonella sp. JGW-45]